VHGSDSLKFGWAFRVNGGTLLSEVLGCGALGFPCINYAFKQASIGTGI